MIVLIFYSSSLSYKIFFCNISEPSAIVVVSSLIYLHSIWIINSDYYYYGFIMIIFILSTSFIRAGHVDACRNLIIVSFQ